ncbi:MAG: outer membrane protein assembly factor BamE [Pseudomonadota bacterium]
MSENHRYSIRSAFQVAGLVSVAFLISACSGMSTASINPVNWITPYKIDVVQGNFVSKEQVDALKPGMTRAQVKDVLGTPLLASVFHADRWDYVFTLKRQGVEPQSLKYTVYFKGDVLERSEGDTMPSEAEFISKLDSKRKLGAVPVLEASEDQLKNAESKKPATTPAVVTGTSTSGAAAVGAPSAAYPPLESPLR